MKFLLHLIFVSLAPIAFLSAEIAGNTNPDAAVATNTAIVPAPRDGGWVKRFQSNIESAATVENVEVILDGDSITDWWPRNGAAVWDREIVPLGVVNYAIAGDRTQHLLWRLEQGQGNQFQPKLVMLMIGTNNLGANSDEEIAAGVEAIVEDYRQRFPDATILLQGIFPRGADAGDPARARIKNINEMISKLGDTRNVLYVDFGDEFLDDGGALSKEVMPDGLHPSEKGYEIWSAAILPTVKKVLGKD